VIGLIGLILVVVLYQIISGRNKPAPKKEKVAVKPEEILRPEPSPEPEPEPVVHEPEPEPSPSPDKEPYYEETQSIQSSDGYPIIDIEGIGPVYSSTLNSIGINTTEDLLEAGSTRKGRDELAEKTEISPSLILEWVNLADLFRIKGVGEEYSDLLEEAGVDTVPELARRNPQNLLAMMTEVNSEKNLVRRNPSLSMVEDWIKQAKELPRRIEY
jgi:predicted flap endonuclease-1-like 5' DNA nuclease